MESDIQNSYKNESTDGEKKKKDGGIKHTHLLLPYPEVLLKWIHS